MLFPPQALVVSVWCAVLVALGLLAMSLDFKTDKVRGGAGRGGAGRGGAGCKPRPGRPCNSGPLAGESDSRVRVVGGGPVARARALKLSQQQACGCEPPGGLRTPSPPARPPRPAPQDQDFFTSDRTVPVINLSFACVLVAGLLATWGVYVRRIRRACATGKRWWVWAGQGGRCGAGRGGAGRGKREEVGRGPARSRLRLALGPSPAWRAWLLSACLLSAWMSPCNSRVSAGCAPGPSPAALSLVTRSTIAHAGRCGARRACSWHCAS